MGENLHYESVYFKELHNEKEYYWPIIYRAGAAVVLTNIGGFFCSGQLTKHKSLSRKHL